MTTEAKRPPAERGQGRKSVQGAGKSPVLQVVVSAEQKAKVAELKQTGQASTTKPATTGK